MSEGRIFKPDKDFTKEVDKQIPEARELAKSNVQSAIDKLLSLEKQTRQASDLASTSQLLVAIVTICKDAGEWPSLSEQVLQLSKKHGQLKQAVTKMVQVVMGFLDEIPDLVRKLAVIETLRTVTDGKIFVEVERARVTRILSNIKKTQGDIKGAADVLCELQVETFGSMERREKTEFILDQVALCIENGDWAQAQILSRKVSTRYIARKPKPSAEQVEKDQREKADKKKGEGDQMEVDEVKRDDVTDLKLRYYEQQILLAKHDDKYLDACKHYRQILDTEAIEEDPDRLRETVRNIIYFIILAPYDNEQSDLLHRIHRDSRTSLVPLEARLLKLFTVPELMRWHLVEEQFGPELCSTSVFSAQEPPPTTATNGTGTTTTTSIDLSKEEAQKQHKRWLDLRRRVIEHNVRVVAKYYTRIRLPRLMYLLGLEPDETERYLSELVTTKTVYARIDRPAGVVSFAKPRQPDDVLNEWSGNMKSLLGLLERIDHLITKEEMMGALGKAR